MTNNAKTPQIRFKGFTDAWEQRKLGETVSFYSGLTYSPNNIVLRDGTLVLRSSNVKDGEIFLNDNVVVKKEIVNSDNVQEGDIIVVVRNGSRALIGKHAKIKKKMDNTVIGAFMTGVRYQHPDFLNSLLNTEKFNHEINKDLGATINQITTSSFKNMEFKFPVIQEEQQKIGTFFSSLDNLITLHQRKLEKLKNVKKSLLEKMFPKTGSVFPEIRFKGFTDAWEQRKLGETVSFYSGLTYSPNNIVLRDGTLVLRSSNVKDGEIFLNDNVVVKKEIVNSDNVQEGDIIVVVRNGSRALIGKHAKIKKKMDNTVIGAFMTGVRYQHPDFLNSLLNTEKFNHEINKDLGATINQITTSSFKNMEFKFPVIQEEQQKIGTFFSSLDNLITLHQRKLEKLKNVKKSLLEKMFV